MFNEDDCSKKNDRDFKHPTLAAILLQQNLNISTNNRGTDKGDFKCYVDYFYEKEFSLLRANKNRLVEVGVRSGASLALWANYFPDIEIFGFDIEAVGSLNGPVKEYINYPSIQFFNQDAYSVESAALLQGKFTILIDDGPHCLNSQLKFLSLYLNKLDENGILIIEDVMFGYRRCFSLMRKLPKGNKFKFEIYDFEKIKSGGGYLFVVRHNTDKKNLTLNKIYITYRAVRELLQVFFRRIRSGKFSFKKYV